MNPSSAAFFEAKYRETPDPWNFARDPAEISRYDAILAALAGRRYHHAFEPGCSIGMLTERLATVCDAVDACDFSESAIAAARRRCAHLPQVHLSCDTLSQATTLAGFDLVVLSEIGYYFSLEEWRHAVAHWVKSLPSNATLLAAHWLGQSADHRISGDQVHQILVESPHLHLEQTGRYPTFRFDKWVRL